MRRTVVIVSLMALMVSVAIGQCPHGFFKAHNLKGRTTCEVIGCSYLTRMKSLTTCALDEARYEMSVRYPGRDAAWAEAEGPEVLDFHDGVFSLPGVGIVFGTTQFLDDGTYHTIIGCTGDWTEDFDTMTHELEHCLASRVLKGIQEQKFHRQLDNGSHTPWYVERQAT